MQGGWSWGFVCIGFLQTLKRGKHHSLACMRSPSPQHTYLSILPIQPAWVLRAIKLASVLPDFIHPVHDVEIYLAVSDLVIKGKPLKEAQIQISDYPVLKGRKNNDNKYIYKRTGLVSRFANPGSPSKTSTLDRGSLI